MVRAGPPRSCIGAETSKRTTSEQVRGFFAKELPRDTALTSVLFALDGAFQATDDKAAACHPCAGDHAHQVPDQEWHDAYFLVHHILEVDKWRPGKHSLNNQDGRKVFADKLAHRLILNHTKFVVAFLMAALAVCA